MQMLQMLRNKKAMAMQHPLVLFVIGFFAVGFLGAIYVIVLAALYSSTESASAQDVINNTLDLFTNFTNQFGTIGTVGGVLVLLVLLGAAGIGAAVAYRRFN